MLGRRDASSTGRGTGRGTGSSGVTGQKGGALESVDRAELELLRSVLEQAAEGALDVRLPPLQSPAIASSAAAVNRLLDLLDAFVRESQACLVSAADGRKHRRFILQGMPGAFGEGARNVNDARTAMLAVSASLQDQEVARAQLVNSTMAVASHVAQSAAHLTDTAADLAASAKAAVTQADQAIATVRSLEVAGRRSRRPSRSSAASPVRLACWP
jgi:methyl-accepting chemotaxis protein